MTPAEIAALLALPPAAAVALERCPGPGWSVSDTGAVELHPENPWPDGRRGRTWCPCSEMTIVRLARSRIPGAYDCALEGGDGWSQALVTHPTEHGRGATSERGETDRLAVLRLLALTA